jgi:uncharacterized protein (DUF433 family)
MEIELDRLTAQVFGISENELSEIRESYRELTKADLREARQEAAEEDNEDDDAIEEENDE